MGRGEREEGKLYDSDRLYLAGMRVKQKILQLSGPLARPHVLHPKHLHMMAEPEPRLRWMENIHLNLGPTMAEYKDMEGCLQKFIRLHKAADQQILNFAREWGILGIRPVREWGEDNPKYDPAFDMWAKYSSDALSLQRKEDQALTYQDGPQVRQFLWHTEKISLWRRLSRHFHAILLLAAAIDSQSEDDTKNWQEVIGMDSAPKNNTHWGTLQYAIHRWTAQAPLTLLLGDRIKVKNRKAPIAHLDINQMPINWTPEMYDECADRNYQDWEFRDNTTYWRGDGYLPMRSSVLLNILVVQLVATVTSPLMRCQNPECSTVENRTRTGKRYCDSPECVKSRARQRQSLNRTKKASA